MSNALRRWILLLDRSASLHCVMALFVLALTQSALAQEPGVRDAPSLPAGLATVWSVVGRRLDAQASAWALAAFSLDGEHVGVSDDGGTRVYRASDGAVERVVPAPLTMGQSAFALALSSTGRLAVGRVGSVDVYALAGRGEPTTYHCRGACGPVTAIAFSPNGAWLAFQASRSALDVTPGSVDVVDLRTRAHVAELAASTTRTGVWFTADGGTLVAASVTRIDDTGTFGVRSWSTASRWNLARDVRGVLVPRGSLGPFAFTERVGAYSRGGNLELRELATGAVTWSMPLALPALDTGTDAVATQLHHVALAPRADLMLSYESPESVGAIGTLVLRRLSSGSPYALYDVAGVSALALAPDGHAFVYATGVGRTYTAVARVPL